jgi:hypothetical protein
MTQEGIIDKVCKVREIEKGWFRLVILVRSEVKQEIKDHPTPAKCDRVLLHALYNEQITDFFKRFKLGDRIFIQSEIKNTNYYHDETMDYFHEKGVIFTVYKIKKIDTETGKKIPIRKHRKMLENMKGN